jgi:glycosyltransferase involved in cell wall biosynthesis
MKVLIVNALYPPYSRGGAEQSVQQLAHDLVQRGVEVVLAATAPRRGGRTVNVDGVKVHFLGIRNVHWPYDQTPRGTLMRKLWHAIDLYNPFMGRAVARLIEAEQPDIVHTNNLQGFSTAVWHASARRGVPQVHTLRDYSLSCARACRFRNGAICAVTCWDCRPAAAAKRAASRQVAAVVGNSADILQRHRDLGFFAAATASDVIHPSGVAPQGRLAAAAAGAGPLNGRHRMRFGYLGRLEPAKGIELLLEVFAAGVLPHELHIAGIGAPAYEAALRQRLGAAAVRWHGWIEAAQFFRDIDVLIVPSLWPEPLPRVILEAYAHGVPVIGARRGGIPEVVRDGESGLLFEPDEPHTLRRAMQRISDDEALWQSLQRGARRQLQADDPRHAAARYEMVYRRVQR